MTAAKQAARTRPASIIVPAGSVFNRLTVIEQRGGKLLCSCACGSEPRLYASSSVRHGLTKSCGCLNLEVRKARITHLNEQREAARTLPPFRQLPEFRNWSHMIERCRNPNSNYWHLYGGRGIAVCERWHSFANFYADMGPRPSPVHSLDRWPNKDGHYEPGNCRWATPIEQSQNTRRNVLLTAFGETKPLSAWAQDHRCLVNEQTLRSRVRRGLAAETAIKTPPAPSGRGAAAMPEILRRRTAGESQRGIALAVGLSQAAVCRALRGGRSHA